MDAGRVATQWGHTTDLSPLGKLFLLSGGVRAPAGLQGRPHPGPVVATGHPGAPGSAQRPSKDQEEQKCPAAEILSQ